MISTSENFFKEIPTIESCIGYTFVDKNLLLTAFTHPSYANEHKSRVHGHNERLEFLGDSVLGLLVADFLYSRLPEMAEGLLSLYRSKIVEGTSCQLFAEKLKIGDYLMLGKGERRNWGRGRESILADLFEALMGAIYLDGGLEAANSFFFSHFIEELSAMIESPQGNWKAELQDFCQKLYQETPIYSVLGESGPDHSKQFEIAVLVQGKEVGRGTGSSKKEAQQQAAKKALGVMQ